jgi:hypothetical protein
MVISALRSIQLVSGFATGLLGLFLFIYITVLDASLPADLVTPAVSTSTKIIVFLMLVLPGMLVAVGTYLQVIHGRVWAMAFILIGALANVLLVILNAGLLYAMSADRFGQRVIMADLLAVAVTFVTSWPNAMLAPVEPD